MMPLLEGSWEEAAAPDELPHREAAKSGCSTDCASLDDC